jgi:hypothetical protein
MTTATAKRNGSPLPSVGLSAWATVQLDAAIGSGVLAFDQLDGLDSRELTEVARRLAAAQLDGVDARAAVADVRRSRRAPTPDSAP